MNLKLHTHVMLYITITNCLGNIKNIGKWNEISMYEFKCYAFTKREQQNMLLNMKGKDSFFPNYHKNERE